MPASTFRAKPSLGWIVTTASLSFSLVSLDVTIVNVALPQLASALGGGMAGLQWVVDAYTLAFAVLLLSAGTLSDRFGARRIYLLGLGIFALASAACSAAQDANGLIAARAVQGLGAAWLVPSSLALLNHACGQDRLLRAKAVGNWHVAGGVAIAAGPVVGGLLLGAFGWRSVFLLNLPVCALGIGMALRLAETPRHARQRFDLPGQALAMLALAALTGAAIEAGKLGWTQVPVLAGFALAILAGLAFVIVEAHSPRPTLPLHFFRLPNFSAVMLLGVIVNLTYYGMIFVLSPYLQQVKHYGAVRAGLAYLPLTATFIFANLLSSRLNRRFGTRLPILLGTVLGACGFALLAQLDARSGFASMLLPFLLIPAGMGLSTPAMTAAILASVEPIWAGTASASLNAARQAGGAVGVAVFGTLAAGDEAQIVNGLRDAGWISAVLLAAAWVVIRLGVRREDVLITRSAEESV